MPLADSGRTTPPPAIRRGCSSLLLFFVTRRLARRHEMRPSLEWYILAMHRFTLPELGVAPSQRECPRGHAGRREVLRRLVLFAADFQQKEQVRVRAVGGEAEDRTPVLVGLGVGVVE